MPFSSQIPAGFRSQDHMPDPVTRQFQQQLASLRLQDISKTPSGDSDPRPDYVDTVVEGRHTQSLITSFGKTPGIQQRQEWSEAPEKPTIRLTSETLDSDQHYCKTDVIRVGNTYIAEIALGPTDHPQIYQASGEPARAYFNRMEEAFQQEWRITS